jgi:flagellar biosynthetic protein FlhB
MATGVLMLWLAGPRLYHGLAGIVRAGLAFSPETGRDAAVAMEIAQGSMLAALRMMLPLFSVLVAAAILASVALGGFVISGKALKPRLERLSVSKGLARMVSAQTMVELLKTLAKAGVVGTIAVLAIAHYHGSMLMLMQAGPVDALVAGIALAAWCCALIVAGLSLIALVDVPWQIYSHGRKLRMSHQDVRQEHKESEGDPQLKGRLRQLRRAMARRRMMADAARADVIVTNPRHFAVALSYDSASGGAPRVVAKGSNLLAGKIRQIGQAHGIPMLSAPPLARALYHNVEIGQEIPAALYAAVAEVLAWVYQLRAWRGSGNAPPQPEHLVVPEGMDRASTEH